MALKKRIVLDFETRSASDLKKEGPFKYSLHPSTQPTCMAFKEHSSENVSLLRFETINKPFKQLPTWFQNKWLAWILNGYLFTAHNAGFERVIYNNILVRRLGWPKIPDRQWRCTAAKAAACALPRNLEGAGAAMNLRTQKDKRGYVAMMATCRPTKQYNNWKKVNADVLAGKRVTERRRKVLDKPCPPMFLEYENNPQIWETLYTYCKYDVKTEEELDDALPDLSESEQEIWFFNQLLNWRGLRLDVINAEKILHIMGTENDARLKELDALTMGLVTKPGSRKSILEFLALDGIELPDIRAKTIDDALADKSINGDMHRLLEIRKALSKASIKKYESITQRAHVDHRVRDILMYHGASTGRDTGTGFQPHNLPRPLIKQNEIEYVYDLLSEYCYGAGDEDNAADETQEFIDWIKTLYGPPGMVFSSLLRGMLIPSEGRELFVADFSKIEVAVLWWLADNWPGIEVLKSGKDPYLYMASANTGRPYEDFNEDSPERQLGKAQVLGAGFGCGWMKFQELAREQYRLKLTDEQSQLAINTYRSANSAVPALWSKYEQAAIKAVERSGKIIEAGKCKFFVKNKFLWIQLPSGRRLAYRNPEIIWRIREYQVKEKNKKTGEMELVTKRSEPKKTLQFWAVNSKTKKWMTEVTWGGTITENIVQATARDLMMPAMLRLEKAGYKALLSVHDEGITEREIGKGSIDEFVKIMCERPSWADENLPLEAKGWRGLRYRK